MRVSWVKGMCLLLWSREQVVFLLFLSLNSHVRSLTAVSQCSWSHRCCSHSCVFHGCKCRCGQKTGSGCWGLSGGSCWLISHLACACEPCHRELLCLFPPKYETTFNTAGFA